MQAIEKERVSQHNQMIQNLINSDTVQSNRLEGQKRSNIQNQKYLRLQMKQKADNAVFTRQESEAHVDIYDFVSSVEQPEHTKKVNEFNMRKLLEQSKYHSG